MKDASYRQYVSCMAQAQCAGDVVIQLNGFGALAKPAQPVNNLDGIFSSGYQIDGLMPTTTVSMIATGIDPTMAPDEVMEVMRSQFDVQLEQYNFRFTGTTDLFLSADTPYACYRMVRGAHALNIWSQTRFEVKILSNDTGAIFYTASTPNLIPLERVKSQAMFNGVSFVMNGQALTDDQIIELTGQASAELISYLNNNITASCYLFEGRGKDGRSVILRPLPGIDFDVPRIRRKQLYTALLLPAYPKQFFDWVKTTGEMSYRPNENYSRVYEPFDLDNEIKLAFTAGNFYISPVIEKAVMNLIALALFGAQYGGNLKSIGGGSFRASFGNWQEALYKVLLSLRSYKMR